METGTGAGSASDATVATGPAVTREQQRAIWDAEADEAEVRLAKLEAKAGAIQEALALARAEAVQLRHRASGGID